MRAKRSLPSRTSALPARSACHRVLAGGGSALMVTALLAACSSSKHSATAEGGTVTAEIDAGIPGWNILTNDDNEYALQLILDGVLPQSFIIPPSLVPQLNTDLLQSATVTSTSPQTIVYKLNPAAKWSDGTPIDADDFIYNWQTQSGLSQYTDVDGKAFKPASSAGYNQIKSVTGSDPAGGAACDPGSAANHNAGLCPNGDTVTVTFSTTFADWQSLFVNLMPAHVARRVGWNTGFNNYKNLVSGSWYQISSYTPDQSVVLTKNPAYWGTPGHLDKVVFDILGSDEDIAPALRNGEVQVMTNPKAVSTALVQQVSAIPSLTASATGGLEFAHLDFNEANPDLAKLQVRQAIAYGTDRQEIIARTVGQIDPDLKPLGNHMFVPGAPGYQDDGTRYDTYDPAKAKSTLQAAGYAMGADGYFQSAGKDLTFTIVSTNGNQIRLQIEELLQAQMKAIGIKLKIANIDSQNLGKNLSSGEYDLALFNWVMTPFPSANQPIYCSYTDKANCAQNWTHSANPEVDRLMAQANAASSTTDEAALYNEADKVLWDQMVTLPLFQSPQYVAWPTNLLNVVPNRSNVGLPWNVNQWGLKAR